MLLSDFDIQQERWHGALTIEPFLHEQLNPASYDVRLSNMLRVPDVNVRLIDTAGVPEGHTKLVEMAETGYVLSPGGFVLGSTVEKVTLGKRLVAKLEGKSSLGRLGLTAHITAGFIDPGFAGDITLEIANHGPWALRLHPGMPIGQLAFETLINPPTQDYGITGRYQGQSGPTESRYRLPIHASL